MRGEVGGRREDGSVYIVLDRDADGVIAVLLDDRGVEDARERVADLADFVDACEPDRPRWTWDHTATWLPELLEAGVRIERAHDLRLVRAILRASLLTQHTPIASSPDGPLDVPLERTAEPADLDPPIARTELFTMAAEPAPPADAAPSVDPVAELQLQLRSIRESADPARLGLLAAAESAGALIAVEMRFAGLPWSVTEHRRVLTEILGPEPAAGQRPAVLAELHTRIEAALDGATVNPDSATDLKKVLQRSGLRIETTSSWELREIDHPVIEPLLDYRKRSRIHTANGWAWLQRWVRNGRFRPIYVPAGVVTGRWASDGGGALQLPHQLRSAVRADPGWALVVADAAQLEPRILAAMAGDEAMIAAGSSGDLYNGLVATGVVETRDQAKVAMLSAMYGGTTGDGGRLLPRLARAYPKAIAMVDAAAREGERGERVRTWLGRTSPLGQRDAPQQQARAWGRFTRNFIVQGTAAEWALCWMGGIRGRLAAEFDGPFPEAVPHLVFFLHDEVIVHTPIEDAERVAEIVQEAARDAGRLLFGARPAVFPLSCVIVQDYASAK